MKAELLYIQYLRAFAALLVVYVHSINQFDAVKEMIPKSFGYAGVDLFFVISGFIMIYSTHGKNITPTKFMLRRIERVVPLYWFFTTALIAVALIIPGVLESVKLEVPHIVSSYLFIPHYSPVFPEQFWPVLIPGWTLNYEMTFYLIFAFSLIFAERFRLALISLIIMILVLIGWSFNLTGIPSFYTDLILIEFLLGAIIGYFFIKNKIKTNIKLGLFVLFFSILLYLIVRSYVPTHHRFFDAGLSAALIVIAALLLTKPENNIKIPLLNEIGNASYSIYLSHVFTLGLFRFIRNSLGFGEVTSLTMALFFIFLSIVFSTIVGLIVYEIIEKPLNLKLRHKPH